MKKKITLVSLFFLFSANAFSQNWLWARAATGPGEEEGFDVATDPAGNVYVTGGFSNTSSITFGSTTLTNVGAADIYLAKYDAGGNVLWAKSAGGTGSEFGYSIATDASGNVYVAGQFTSASFTFGSSILTNAGAATYDVYLAKYNSAGVELWARSAGGSSDDRNYGIATDGFGNVYITGIFLSDTMICGADTLFNAGSHDLFIVKYDSSGNEIWAKGAGGTSADFGCSVATDNSNNVLLTGYFGSSSVTFGTTTLNNTASFTQDMFLVKYDTSGNVIWARSDGGTGREYAYNAATDASGNIFVTGGYTSSALTFGSTTLYNTGINTNFFIVKYDTNGNAIWAKGSGGTGSDLGYCVATDAAGGVFVSGMFTSSYMVFGYDTLFYPAGSTDPIFLVKYNSAGTVRCASVLASGGDDQDGIATDAAGHVYVGGDFFNVNPFIVGADSLPRTGTENVFVAKYSCELIESVNGFGGDDAISVYPNPAHNQFTVVLNGESPMRNGLLEIYDAIGKRVYFHFINGNHETINCEINPGLYFVKVSGGEKEYVQKLLIE